MFRIDIDTLYISVFTVLEQTSSSRFIIVFVLHNLFSVVFSRQLVVILFFFEEGVIVLFVLF